MIPTTWEAIFLGVIAVATLIMATIQIGAIVYVGRLARRLEQLADRVEKDLTPVLGRLKDISADASRVATLAVAQAERADRLLADFARRLDDTISLVQAALVVPAREGLALLKALKAGFDAFRGLGVRTRARGRGTDEEDALFIG